MAADDQYSVWYSDAFGRGRRRLAEWTRLDAERKLNQIGILHELLLPLDSAPAVLLQRDARVDIWRNDSPLMETAWYIRRFGFVERAGLRYVSLGGYDALYHLAARIVVGAATSARAVKEGPADDVIKAYARENLGSLADVAERDLSAYLVVADDESAGPDVSRRVARQNLWRVMQGICFESAQRGSRLYVDLVPLPDGRLELRTFVDVRGVDHRRAGLGPVALSVDVGTLQESERSRDYTDEHSYVYVGGRGIDAERLVVEVGDDARAASSPFGRREVWVDGRYLSSSDSLTALGNATLWQGLPVEQISGLAGAGFGERWGFGDLVEAALRDEVADCRVDQCRVIVAEDRIERARVGLYELAAENALLSVLQQVEHLGVQESPEFTTVPTAGAGPLALPSGFLDDGWLSDSIARTLDLAAEVAARAVDIAAEASLRASADTSLSADIAAEAAARASADSTEAGLRAAADSSEASTRAAADSSEASTRAAADTSLSGLISAETSARAAADSAESTARSAADTILSADIAAEATARAAAVSSEASARAAADSAHAVLTTGAHGGIVAATDARLSDARTPTAHKTTHQHGGGDEIATATPGANAIPKAGAGSTLADGWLSSGIARASDVTAEASARAAADSTHAALTTGAHGGIVASSDARLSDARTPTSHAASHKDGGGDEIATATPGANVIPKTGASGNLDSWISSALARIASANSWTSGQTFVPPHSTANNTLTVMSYNVLASGVTPAAGFGQDHVFNASSDTQNRNQHLQRTSWVSAVDASRKARTIFYTFDTAAREGFRIEASGSAPMIGFLGAAAVVRQVVAALTVSVGTADGTVADVGAAFNQTTLNNNFRDLADKINQLRTALVNLGLVG